MNAKEYYGYLEDARRKQDAIKHYGTNGQKWGVRHWQYPDGRFTDEGKARYFGSKNNDENIGIAPEAAALAFLAATSVATAATTRVADAIHNSTVNKRIKNYEEKLLTEKVDKKTGLRIKSDPDSTFEDDMKTINMEHGYNMFSEAGLLAELVASPKYNEKRDGYTQNCMLCTTAMDLKRKGYDVRAGKSADGYEAKELKKWYKDPDIKKGSYKEVIEELKQLPEGAYGNFMCYWNMGGGHSMFFRIEKGKVAIYDTQVNRKINNIDKVFGYYKSMIDKSPNRTYYLRTDNLELNIDYLKEHNLIRY